MSWNSGFFDTLADSFAKIEVKDIRVTEINMSRDYLRKIWRDPSISTHMGSFVNSPLNMCSGNLWGAKINIVPGIRKLNIMGEDGFLNPETGQRYRASVYGCLPDISIIVKTRAPEITKFSKPEIKAIETLREMISESEYRKYIKYGFLLVPGRNGVTYQIFKSQWHTKVWKNGKIIEEICVRLRDRNCPPTDDVIAFKTMIEIDEQEFRSLGNVYNMRRAA